ncbi:hypothetical protein ACH5RR_010170 [Cinchona calisaya]|uniref:Uncharacterized protein n=1 Tax=Cinchona calisaya TaxID=153742 RepID=A0ABD3AGX4_9GENT
MAISGKDIQDCMRKVGHLSMKFAWAFAKRHPYISCSLIFFILVYVCSPSLFWLLIYLSSFLFLAASIAKIYYGFGSAKNSKRDEKNSDAKPLRTSVLVKNDVHAQSVRRRKSKEIISSDDYLQSREEEKSTVFASTCNNDVVDKSALIEENTKTIREVGVDHSVKEHGECSSSSNRDQSHQGSRGFDGGRGEIETDSSEEEGDERDREENNKAVQWTKDDQKNLMDLGISEMERNKRLESLIARRKVRKLMSLQARRALMKGGSSAPFGHITPLMVPRNNNLSYGQFTPMPGSAPPVLLPMETPFDIPYEPQEEKPVLTGGSFDQEFLPLLQKDIFCRHESFSQGPFFPGEMQDYQQETSQCHDPEMKQRTFQGHDVSNLESQLDQKDTDKITEVEPSKPLNSNSNIVRDLDSTRENVQSPEEETSEVKAKSMIIDGVSANSSPTSSSEEDEQFSRVDREAILKSLASPVYRKDSKNGDSSSDMEYYLNNSGPSMLFENRMEEGYFFTDRATLHAPTNSFASDLQVEVSEINSPPLTIDGSIWSHDEEVSVCEGSVESEINYSSEDISEASSHLYGGLDENQSRLSVIHEVNENDTVEVSSTKSYEDHVVLHKLAETGCSEKQEQPSYCAENTKKEVNTIYNANASSILQENDNENFSTGDKDRVADAWIQGERDHRPHTEWSVASSQTYTGHTGSQQEMDEHHNIYAHYNPVKGHDDPGNLGDSGGESIDIPQHETLNTSIPVEECDIPESNENNEGEQQRTGQGFPGVYERYTGDPVSRLPPQLMVQQVPIATIIPLSPKSVLQPKFSQSSLSNLSEETRMEIQEFGTLMAENNIFDDPRGESLTSTVLHSTTFFIEDPASHISDSREAKMLQESSNTSTTSTEDANFTGSASEQVVHENEGGQTELNDFPEGNRQNVSSPESTASELKPVEKSISRMSNDERSKELSEEEAPSDFANHTAQVNHLNVPPINLEETTQHQGNSSGISYEEEMVKPMKKNEMLVQEMEERSKYFLRNLMEAFKD